LGVALRPVNAQWENGGDNRCECGFVSIIRWESISCCASLFVTLSAVVITAGASAGLNGGERDARTIGNYVIGMVVFVIAKGGLMLAPTKYY